MGEEFEMSIPADVVAILQGFYEKQKEVTGMMKEEGVDMLAGSDLGGIWVLPGFGLHQEFEELAGAGFTPLEVLQATTLNGARFLGREATMGSVEEGKEADLVLLDANPLEDVANLHGIAGVVLNGKYFSAADLDEMKAEVAASYGR
jgi:imidazolonepropionase-like amidohydrolase